MATNEPMTGDMLTDGEREIITEEYIRSVKRECADALAEADRLRAENAAMRPVVEAVAAGDMTYSDPEFGDVNCIFNCAPGSRFGFHHAANCQARAAQAFVAAHPATAADGEGQ